MKISLENVTKMYEQAERKTLAVQKVFIHIDSGEFFFLLGPSGCGKTTLLRLIAGLLEPTSGRILFDGKEVTHLPVEKRNTAMVFQGYALWPHLTVLENVEFGPRMQGMKRRERRSIADDQLNRVEMSGFGDRKPNQLSGGQQQRVALARALAARSGCLLLDEPLSNLDARLRLHMREELRQLVKSSGITAVYVTHDQKEALSMADRIAVMDSGRIVQIGTPEQLYNQPATRFVADFLGEANFIDGQLKKTGPPVIIQTSLGEIYAADAREIPLQTVVTCCIRPEHITLLDAESKAQKARGNVLFATITSSIYLGEIQQYTCVLGKKQDIHWKITVLADGADRKKIGDRIYLYIAPEHIALLEK